MLLGFQNSGAGYQKNKISSDQLSGSGIRSQLFQALGNGERLKQYLGVSLQVVQGLFVVW